MGDGGNLNGGVGLNKRSIGSMLSTAAFAFVVTMVTGCGFIDQTREVVDISQSETSRSIEIFIAEGYIVPIEYATLSASTQGRITNIEVSEGDYVEAGALLLHIDDRSQKLALAEAEANVARAEANLKAAEALLDGLLIGATPERIASARQSVTVAEADLERAIEGPTPEEVNSALAILEAAEAGVRRAQAAYDSVADRADIESLPQALDLEQATIEYERAKSSYQNLMNGATPAEIRVYEERVSQAKAALNEVLADASSSDLAVAEAEVESSQANLEAARVALEQSRVSIEDTDLRAPFAGVIGAISVRVGEYLTPGLPVARLGDTSAWVVETDDLSELDVMKISEGQTVQITVDAFPGETLHGAVRVIQPASELKRGDVTYTVTIDLDKTDLPLCWGMTAAVILS